MQTPLWNEIHGLPQEKALEKGGTADLIDPVTPSRLKDGQNNEFPQHLQETSTRDNHPAP